MHSEPATLKSSIIVACALLECALIGHSAPLTFDEFKTLPKAEQRKAYETAPPELQKKLFQWRRRVHLGESWWQRELNYRVVSARGFDALGALLGMQRNLRHQAFAKKLGAIERAEITNEEKLVRARAWEAKHNAIDEQYAKAVQFLVALAATPEALVLNKKAEALVIEWNERFPQGIKRAVSEADVKALDEAGEGIFRQLRKLPRLTAAQLAVEYEALPDEEIHR